MSPIRKDDLVKGMRQRQRADGSWRLWWEPSAADRARGIKPVDLDADRPSWSIRKAKELNKDAAPDRAPRTGVGGRTLDALCELYLTSRFFLDKAPSTQADYEGKIAAIRKKWGTWAVIDFTKPVMNEWYETLLSTGKKDWAGHLLGMMSILMSFAEIQGWRPENSNPCFRMKRKGQTKRDRIAEWAEYDALIEAADAMADEGAPVMRAVAAAIALATMTAQRQTDICQARIEDFKERACTDDAGQPSTALVWELTRSKRKTAGAIPIHPEILWRIRNLLDTAEEDQTYLLLDVTGKPFTKYRINRFYRQVRDRAARTEPRIKSLQFRDLRRTFGNWARMGGADKSDVADVLGNKADQDAGLSQIYMAPSLEAVLRAQAAVQRPKKAG